MKLTFDVPDDIALGLKRVVEETIAELTKWPQRGDDYYYIRGNGEILRAYYNDALFDKERLEFGNMFKTKEEAEFKREQLKVLHELEELADDDQPWDNLKEHYAIYYSHLFDCISTEVWLVDQQVSNTYYFKSIESARAAISKIGEERLKKYYFCIPEDKT